MTTNLYSNIKLHATPTDPEHLVPKSYVDAAVNKKVKDAVRVVSTSNIDGTYSSANKTLTVTALPTVDGVTLTTNNRVLLAGQTDATQNGIYTVTSTTVLTRSEDFDDSAEIPLNVLIPVSEGTQNGDTIWQLTNDSAVTLDTTSMSFAKSGGGVTGTQSFSATITGDGTATSFAVNHGLNTENVVVSIRDHTSKALVLMGWDITSTNVITVKPDVVLTSSDSFDVTVVG